MEGRAKANHDGSGGGVSIFFFFPESQMDRSSPAFCLFSSSSSSSLGCVILSCTSLNETS